MDVTDPDHSLTVCVNKCPEKQLNTREEIFRFSEQTGSLLCHYDLQPVHYFQANNSNRGPCPRLPVYERWVGAGVYRGPCPRLPVYERWVGGGVLWVQGALPVYERWVGGWWCVVCTGGPVRLREVGGWVVVCTGGPARL